MNKRTQPSKARERKVQRDRAHGPDSPSPKGRFSRMPPALKALIAQIVSTAVVVAISASTGAFPIGDWGFVFAQSATAVLVAAALRSAPWWLGIHLAFAPALVAAARLPIPPAWYLGAFVVLALIYWTSFRTQVPLFLSNRATSDALLALLPEGSPHKLADLGCGTGSLLVRLARARPDCRFTGVEAAPLPFLVARLSKRGANLELRWGDFWKMNLGEYDYVYAFLSPVPMARLWDKVRAEMRAGSLLVSNSFPVPNVAPTRVVDVPDRRRTRLYCYRV
jgi:hypothetical protein